MPIIHICTDLLVHPLKCYQLVSSAAAYLSIYICCVSSATLAQALQEFELPEQSPVCKKNLNGELNQDNV